MTARTHRKKLQRFEKKKLDNDAEDFVKNGENVWMFFEIDKDGNRVMRIEQLVLISQLNKIVDSYTINEKFGGVIEIVKIEV